MAEPLAARAEEARDDRKRLLAQPCGECGQGAGFLCVSAGGHELSIANSHAIRFSQSRVNRGEVRALLAKARLV